MHPKTSFRIAAFCAALILMFSACKKSVEPATEATDNTDLAAHHSYGLLPADPSRYLAVPVYTASQIKRMFPGSESLVSGPEPASYTLASPPVRNQEQIGSCTAFTGSADNEILRYYQTGSFPATLSPLYLYYVERVKIEGYRITADPGAQMIDIPEALQKYGQCIETDYPYPTNANETAGPSSKAYRTAPNAAAVSNALNYEIGQTASSYAMVAQADTASVITLLRSNIPVMLGFNVYDNSGYTIFEGLNTTNYTYSPLNANGTLKSGLSLLGGHANVIIGYDNTRQAFLMENSWGTDWGNAGYWYLPYSVFQSTKIVPTGNVYWQTL
jgi:hypothetical protein